MKNEMSLDGYGVMEVKTLELIETDGGYGYHSSQNAGAKIVGEAIGNFFSGFFDGFYEGHKQIK
jgi:hypothetical protein